MGSKETTQKPKYALVEKCNLQKIEQNYNKGYTWEWLHKGNSTGGSNRREAYVYLWHQKLPIYEGLKYSLA